MRMHEESLDRGGNSERHVFKTSASAAARHGRGGGIETESAPAGRRPSSGASARAPRRLPGPGRRPVAERTAERTAERRHTEEKKNQTSATDAGMRYS